jgi:hypothetical protein
MASYLGRGGGGQYENMAKEKYFSLGKRLYRLNSGIDQKDLLGIAGKIIDNLIHKHDDPKYLCLKMSNAVIAKRVVGRHGGSELLHGLGFHRVRDAGTSAFILSQDEIDLNHFFACKTWVEEKRVTIGEHPVKLPTLTVRVRQLNGISLLAPFFIEEPMREVYEHVKLYRTDGGGGDFVLCSTYPQVVYDPNGDMMKVAVGQLFEGTEKVNLIIQKPTKVNRITEDTVSSSYNGLLEQDKTREENLKQRQRKAFEAEARKNDRKKALASFQEDREVTKEREQRRRTVACIGNALTKKASSGVVMEKSNV